MTDFKSLHEKALSLAMQYKTLQMGLLDVLQEIDATKAFKHLGFGSLWEYCRWGLTLSESDASAFIRVARKSVEVPELKRAVREGRINLSAAKRVASVVTAENKNEWLKKASELSQRELEMAIAEQDPKALVRDRIKPLREDKLELKCCISLESERLIRRVQDIESQRRRENVDLEQALIAMAQAYLRANDPVERAKRQKMRRCSHKGGVLSLSSETTKPENGADRASPPVFRSIRTPMPQAVTHAVNRRDEGRCVWTDPRGKRCESRRFVELHHIQPLSHGGKHDVQNIATVCKGHHQAIHEGTVGFRLAV
jgi:hypothetical protein